MAEKGTLYDPLRQSWVSATPEECVRQKVLHHLREELGYPSSLLVVEKSLQQLPHLIQKEGLPERRLDILCYGKGIHPLYDLYPLLMIECKASTLNENAMQQVIGYNHYVQSYFLAVASPTEVKTGWWDREQQQYIFHEGLYSYEELLRSLC